MQEGYRIPAFRRLEQLEEALLIERWQKHKCYASRTRVVNANLKFIARTAGKFKAMFSYVKPEDLVGYGTIGFIHSLDTFDSTMGYRIRTWAVRWIMQSIQKHVHSNESSIRLPSNAHEELRKKAKKREEFTDIEKIFVDNYKGVIHIEDKVGGDDSSLTIGDKYAHINSDAYSQPDNITHNNMTSEYLANLIDSLPDNERMVIQSIYGINRNESTLRGVGDGLPTKMSHEGVRKLRNQAYKRMRAHMDATRKITFDDVFR